MTSLGSFKIGICLSFAAGVLCGSDQKVTDQPALDASVQQLRDAIDHYRAMSARYPGEAIYLEQLSRALIAAGCGQKAREEARRATEIDPKSALAFQNLGQVLAADLIGRQFEVGFDLSGAEAAFRKALELDPKDEDSRIGLALVLEFPPKGKRYTSQERLREAINLFQHSGENLFSNEFGVNMLYDLAYVGSFEALRTEAEKFAPSDRILALKLVAITKLEGPAAALAQCEREKYSESEGSSALQLAGRLLANLREYQAAAELTLAGTTGAQNPSEVVSRANFFRSTKRSEAYAIKTDTPENLIRSYYFAVLFGTEEDLVTLSGEELMVGLSMQQRKKILESAQRQTWIEPDVFNQVRADDISSNSTFSIDKNGDHGLRVRAKYLGRSYFTWFVAPEGRQYRLLRNTRDFDGIGRRVLADVKEGNLAAARQWLDWVCDEIKIEGGEDALAGPVFPRVWRKGVQSDPAAINYAASVLIGSSENGSDAIPALRAALAGTKMEPSQTLAELAYVDACRMAGAWQEALEVSKMLAAAHPESTRAAEALLMVYSGLRRWNDVKTFAAQRLTLDTGDLFAGRAMAEAQAGEGKFQESEALYRKLAGSSKGGLPDWNQLGWFSLFAGDVTADKIAGLQQALGNNTDPNALQTLAAMYAEMGKATEARETMLAAMHAWKLQEPNSQCWLVFGRLAELFGVLDEAESDYRKVEKEDNDPFFFLCTSTATFGGFEKVED